MREVKFASADTELLGCICQNDVECTRNCRTDETDDHEMPTTEPSVTVVVCDDDDGNCPASTASERLFKEEACAHKDAVAVEAWSNGLLRIWFAADE